MDWWTRVRGMLCPRRKHVPPVLTVHDDTDVGLARDALEAERARLASVQARDPEVDARSAHLDQIHKANNLGPKFWAAVGQRRA